MIEARRNTAQTTSSSMTLICHIQEEVDRAGFEPGNILFRVFTIFFADLVPRLHGVPLLELSKLLGLFGENAESMIPYTEDRLFNCVFLLTLKKCQAVHRSEIVRQHSCNK